MKLRPQAQNDFRVLGSTLTSLLHVLGIDLADNDLDNDDQSDDDDEREDLDGSEEEDAEFRQLAEDLGHLFGVLARMDYLFNAKYGPRGPYNQFKKSEDFFRFALSFDTRCFRSLFR